MLNEIDRIKAKVNSRHGRNSCTFIETHTIDEIEANVDE